MAQPTRIKASLLNRLFSIQPGEEQKTFLLYGLHFIFWLGLRWGDTASYTLYLNDRGAAGLSLMFIGNAAIAFVVGLIYNSFADRVNNERLLLVLLGLLAVWLVSVQGMLLYPATSRPGGVVYPYFYLSFWAFADLTALHILTYINDFYDTRAAKQSLPFLLSASFAGAMVAGLSVKWLALTFMPLAWLVCVGLMIGLLLFIRRQWRGERHQLDQGRLDSRSHRAPKGAWTNLREGFRFVQISTLLRVLALSTLLLTLLMKLLTFQASVVFVAHFQGDPVGLKNFNGLVDTFSNLAGLLLPSLVFRPLLANLGVGVTNLLFPVLTLATVGALSYAPTLGTAINGRLTDRLFKKAFRNPVDALLYNSVPGQVRGRARGFINGLVTPLGTLGAGLLLLAMQRGWFSPRGLSALGLLLGGTYVFLAYHVRRAYSKAMTDLLAAGEASLLALGEDLEWYDPATLLFLERQLNNAQDERTVIFLAETLYDLQGRKALPRLQELTVSQGPQVRAAIIRLISTPWSADPIVGHICLRGLHDPDLEVRRAAVVALTTSPDAEQNKRWVKAFLACLNDPDEVVQASVIPLLLASGDFYYLMPAVRVLSEWLSENAPTERRMLGLQVLFKTGDEQLARTLIHYTHDPVPAIRKQATALIGDLAARSAHESFQQWGQAALSDQLDDADEQVRLIAVQGLGRLPGAETSRILLPTLGDPAFAVRRAAGAALQVFLKPELAQALASPAVDRATTAAAVLCRLRRGQLYSHARHYLAARLEGLIVEAYQVRLQSLPFQSLQLLGGELLTSTLQEEADELVEQALWLVGILSGEQRARAIWQALHDGPASQRANAWETLETLTSPRLARLVMPLYDGTPLPALAHYGQETLALSESTPWSLFQRAWPALGDAADQAPASRQRLTTRRSSWLQAVVMYLLVELSTLDDHDQVAEELIAQAARATLQLPADPLVHKTASWVLTRLKPAAGGGAQGMMSLIEKAIFIKAVSIFQEMTAEELRVLAGISEEATYSAGQRIVTQGGSGDTLYIIVHGQVLVQQRSKVNGDQEETIDLALLGPRESFAEMSLFDNEPYSADVIAQEPTGVLLVRREPLMALIKRDPEIAVGLFKVFSRRLRQANARIAQLEAARL